MSKLKDFIKRLGGRNVDMPDPVEERISEEGYVSQPRLWRRLVMAQMFQLLRARHYYRPLSEENYDSCIRRRANGYAWGMTADELHAQARLQHADPEQFAERQRWFNKELLRSMAADLPAPDRNKALELIDKTSDVEGLAKAADRIRKLYARGAKSKTWYDAFKGAGAYFTMKNMILFHKCNIHTLEGEILDRDDSFDWLKSVASNPETTGKQLFGEMMKLIRDNNFDFRP